jgi:tRNA(Leu) C34 or U34 (ribose-2'-O)-methylase TrmL
MRNDDDLRRHLLGKKHAAQVAQQSRTKNSSVEVLVPTHSVDLFSSTVGKGASRQVGIRVITCDLENTLNAGQICRLMGNFCPHPEEGQLRLLHLYSKGNEISTCQFSEHKMKKVARGCQKHVKNDIMSVEEYVHTMQSDTHRPPLLVVETAKGAVSIHKWRLKMREGEAVGGGNADGPCVDVLLGGEAKGVHQSILAALRPGYDEMVYIPMAGFCVSMNVATALAVVLFEVRRQHAVLDDEEDEVNKEEEQEKQEEEQGVGEMK